MLEKTFPVGKFLVTPLTRKTAGGDYTASVSIRRGMHDRIYRFTARFASEALATCYALQHGSSMAQLNELH